MSTGGISWFVCDTETSGLQVGYSDLLEISLIRCSDRLQISRTIKALNPRNASIDALKITGKTMDDLKKGVHITEAIDDINKFFEQDGLTPAHRCVVGHNAGFDRRFLHHAWKAYDRDFLADLWIDSIPMCKRLAAQMGQPKARLKLDMAMDLFGLKKVGGLHTAKGDSRNTYYLWKHLMDSKIEYLDLIKQIPQRKMEEISMDDMSDFE